MTCRSCGGPATSEGAIEGVPGVKDLLVEQQVKFPATDPAKPRQAAAVA
jgi:hypothetical protein